VKFIKHFKGGASYKSFGTSGVVYIATWETFD
jgi:hypothetical protein